MAIDERLDEILKKYCSWVQNKRSSLYGGDAKQEIKKIIEDDRRRILDRDYLIERCIPCVIFMIAGNTANSEVLSLYKREQIADAIIKELGGKG